ncbi:hypothetical protein [Pseudomonas sp. NPDC089569]|uniref:hypothetical protein n=1 Tax=Pseudomonas sp. NPDC089569 TaxID=3390722 RepID=UPI003D0168D5
MTTSVQEEFPTTSIGEAVETIISMKGNGRYGEYLGCDAQGVETVRVDGMTFTVGPQGADGCIPVLHVESGAADLVVVGEELCYAIDRTLRR